MVSDAFRRFVDEAFERVGGREAYGANTFLAEALDLSPNYVAKLKSYEGSLREAGCFRLAAFIERDPLEVLRAANHGELADELVKYIGVQGLPPPAPSGQQRTWLTLFAQLTQDHRRILTETAQAFAGEPIARPGLRRVRDAPTKRKKLST